MQEVMWHGLGGQGVVVASSVLGTAIGVYEGKYVMSIPSFGAQRRGAPVTALTRISESPIRRRSKVGDPDYVVVLDDSLVRTAITGCGHEKPRQIIVNSKKSVAELGLTEWPDSIIVDAEAIALETIGRPIVNCVMVGVVAAATHLVKLSSVEKAIADVLDPRIAQRNAAGAKEGYNAVDGRASN
jgi:2-oxoisovalerate ferredoxin oxidoreductase gamma subunit